MYWAISSSFKWFHSMCFIENKIWTSLKHYFFVLHPWTICTSRSVDLILKLDFQINSLRYAYFQVSESGSRYIMHTNISHHPLDIIFITCCKLQLTYGNIYAISKMSSFQGNWIRFELFFSSQNFYFSAVFEHAGIAPVNNPHNVKVAENITFSIISSFLEFSSLEI